VTVANLEHSDFGAERLDAGGFTLAMSLPRCEVCTEPSLPMLRPSLGVALFPQNRTRVLIRYDLTDADVQQFAEADRRVVDPPIQVQTAMWSSAGQLDWWVRERQEWWGQGTWCGRAATLDQSR
jgi:hypothetical protein